MSEIAETICPEPVYERPWYIHRHTCGKRARCLVVDPHGREKRVCGVHRRSMLRRPNWSEGNRS